MIGNDLYGMDLTNDSMKIDLTEQHSAFKSAEVCHETRLEIQRSKINQMIT